MATVASKLSASLCGLGLLRKLPLQWWKSHGLSHHLHEVSSTPMNLAIGVGETILFGELWIETYLAAPSMPVWVRRQGCNGAAAHFWAFFVCEGLWVFRCARLQICLHDLGCNGSRP